jgi:nucleolar pre-ribosomal-associated protein 1
LLSYSGLQKFKAFLESILYPKDDQISLQHVQILTEYLQSQKPQNRDDEDGKHVQHIIQTWHFAAETKDDSLFSSTTAVLALLVRIISTRLDLRDDGLALCRTILHNDQVMLLSRGLSAPKHKEHIISPTLRLLTEVISFDGGVMGRQLYSKRNWTFDPKTIARNLSLVKAVSETNDDLQKAPSVRSNTIRYLLANLRLQHEGAQIDIISQNAIIKALFEGFPHDSAQQVANILAVLDTNVIQNRRLSVVEKGRMFGEKNLATLCTFYRRGVENVGDTRGDEDITNVFHQFMLRICTSPESPVVRKSFGWYPPQSDTQHDLDAADQPGLMHEYGFGDNGLSEDKRHKITIRNVQLADLAQALRPHANEKERELLVAIFTAFPELVADYWFKKVNFSFEPKLTATWIGYATLIFSSILLEIPPNLGQSNGYSSYPPPVSIVLENLLPSPLNQKILTKCLNHSSDLISLFGIRILTIALRKLSRLFILIDNAGTNNQRWSHWKSSIVSSFAQRCPKMKEIITAFRRGTEINVIRREAVARLLALYYEVLPEIALEEKLDISLALTLALQKTDFLHDLNPKSAMKLCELDHLVSVTKHSFAMNWWKRPESLKYSPFLTLLMVRARSSHTPGGVDSLLKTVVRDAGMLQSDTKPPALDALISTLQGSDVSDSTLAFIDQCLHRYFRRPIFYEDDLESLILLSRSDSLESNPISLWLMTLLEQWPFVEKSRDGSSYDVAIWLARFLAALKTYGEDDEILSIICKRLQESSQEDHLRELFRNCLNKSVESSGPEDVEIRSSPTNHTSPEHQSGEHEHSRFIPPPISTLSNFEKFKSRDIATLLESQAVSNLLLGLSSSDLEIRMQSLVNLELFTIRLSKSNLDGKEMLYLLLGELTETFHSLSDKHQQPLAYLVTYFAVHAMPVLSEPTHAMFSKVSNFLTLRPSWNPYRLIRYFIESIILAEPSDNRDTAPWREAHWFLSWIYDGLRTSTDCEILQKVGAWEALGSLGAHPVFGSSKARIQGPDKVSDSRLHHGLRTRILAILGRALAVEEQQSRIIKVGCLAWLDTWQLLGWAQPDIVESVKLNTVL